jgi:hypothetical protein
MLGFTVGGESVPGSLVGSASAIVNGICFIIGGLMALPGWALVETPDLADYQCVLWVIPGALAVGAFVGLMLRDPEPAGDSAHA